MVNNREFKVNYRTVFHPKESTVYTQTVNLTFKNVKTFLKHLQTVDDLLSYAKSPIKRAVGVLFLNLTQKRELEKLFNLKLLDRNTCINVLDKHKIKDTEGLGEEDFYCPKCHKLANSKDISPGYFRVCDNCDEDFYMFELVDTEEQRQWLKKQNQPYKLLGESK